MIVKNLKESRERLDLKQVDIAKIFPVTKYTVSGWETGKDTIPLRRLIDYANYYNFSLDYLFGLSKNKTRNSNLTIDLNNLAQKLKDLRITNQMTQADVAKYLNTSQAAYAHYENARYLIPTSFLITLTKIYKPFSIDDLFK